jgi:ribonuclease BN (tRNA processing enzyme)
LKITVLGCYGPYPKAGGACSGYLLEDESTKILIDCGNGVLSRLFISCSDINKLDAVFISHLHPDHMSDLMVLRYAVSIGKMKGKVFRSLPLFLPGNPREDYERIQYNNAYHRTMLQEETKIIIKDCTVTFKRTDHPVECYAMAFKAKGKKIVYSGDTKYFQGLVEFACGSDLFLCEAGILEKDLTENIPHLSAKQGALIAEEAGVKRIILTHFLPDVSRENLVLEAREYFTGILEMAEEGKTYYI